MAKYTPYGEYLAPNQFGADDTRGLTAQEASSVCGPALAVGFARVNGRNPTLAEATSLARQFGWNPTVGMAGPRSQAKLMERMGIGVRLEDRADPYSINRDVMEKRPVGISTAKHYYMADGYDSDNDKYHVGNTGLARIGGAKWMSLREIEALDGGINGVLRMNPTQPEYDNQTARDDGFAPRPALPPYDSSTSRDNDVPFPKPVDPFKKVELSKNYGEFDKPVIDDGSDILDEPTYLLDDPANQANVNAENARRREEFDNKVTRSMRKLMPTFGNYPSRGGDSPFKLPSFDDMLYGGNE